MERSRHAVQALLLLLAILVLAVAVAHAEPTAPLNVTELTSGLLAGDDLFWLNPQPQGNPLTAVSCATATRCYAISSVTILTSDDGGQHWTTVYAHAGAGVDGRQDFLRDVECIDVDRCLVVGSRGAFIPIVGGEVMVGFESGDIPNFMPDQVSCATEAICYAASDEDGAFWKSEDGGLTWQEQNPIVVDGMNGMVCPALDRCIVVGFVYHGSTAQVPRLFYTADGGESWSQPWLAEEPNTGTFTDITCPSSQRCIATGSNPGRLVRTDDGGERWETVFGPATNTNFSSVSCLADGTCYATATDDPHDTIYESSADDTTWEPRAALTIDITDMSCSHQCVLVGHSSIWTGAGDRWQPQVVHPHGRVTYTGIECPTPESCLAVGNETTLHMELVNFSLQSSAQMTTSHRLDQLSCPAADVCYATVASSDGLAVVKSEDGGESWSQVFKPSDQHAFGSIDCPSVDMCIVAPGHNVIDYQYVLYRTQDGGQTWEPHPLDVADAITGVDCPSVRTCYAVASSYEIFKTSNGGDEWYDVSWVDAGTPGMESHLYHIACRNSLDCTAVGDFDQETLLLMTHDGGETWEPHYPDLPGALTNIHCIADGRCMAIGEYTEYLDGRVSYVLSNQPDSDEWINHQALASQSPIDVACLDPKTCFVVGYAGMVLGTGSALPHRVALPVLHGNTVLTHPQENTAN